MPVQVTCRCGQSFSAADHLYGKQVRCPSCGGQLDIANPAAKKPAPAASGAPGIVVTCACGRSFKAPASMRGKAGKCPNCGGRIDIPAAAGTPAPLAPLDIMNVDPLQLGAAPIGGPAPLTGSAALGHGVSLGSSYSGHSGSNHSNLWLIGGIAGGGVLVLMIVVAVIAVSSMGGPEIAEVPPQPGAPAFEPTPAPTPATPAFVPPSAAPAPPPAQATSPPPSSTQTPSQGFTGDYADASQRSPYQGASGPYASSSQPGMRPGSGPPGSSSSSSPAGTAAAGGAAPGATPAGVPLAQLPTAVQSWYGQSGATLKGMHRTGDAEVHLLHISWMADLLPFLGHNDVYARLDRTKNLEDNKNLQVGGVVIPEFINPLDDRTRWVGYPFHNMALTHFAGMSGVEDSRNVVAAQLPRSDPRAGVFGYDEVAKPADITDGTSNTIMVVGTGTLANPWIMGGGATVRGAREPLFDKVTGLGTRGLAGGGTIVTMADGSVRQISPDVDPKVFKAMCTIHGAEAGDYQSAAPPFSLDSLKSGSAGR